MKILIIGQGNVAVNLQYAFRKKQLDVPMVSSREGLENLPTDADVYIYAVSDTALEQVAAKVHVARRALHVHTSGTIPLTIFGEDKPHAGVLYPFQTFTKQRLIEDFSNIPVFIEARNIDDISAIYSLALMLSQHVYETTQHDRERLHLTGVLVNNFPNYLYSVAERVLRDTHIPFKALFPLIDETAAKLHELTPMQAQTGPARRGDTIVMQRHLNLLNTPEDRELYTLISDQISRLYNAPHTPESENP